MVLIKNRGAMPDERHATAHQQQKLMVQLQRLVLNATHHAECHSNL